MIVFIDKLFEKDTDKIKDKALLYKIADCIEQVKKADTIKAIIKSEKIKRS